jgi:hypothetical protein
METYFEEWGRAMSPYWPDRQWDFIALGTKEIAQFTYETDTTLFLDDRAGVCFTALHFCLRVWREAAHSIYAAYAMLRENYSKVLTPSGCGSQRTFQRGTFGQSLPTTLRENPTFLTI